MPYAQNLLPRDPFPRGLGELAQRASGFGTWVVDMHWGLSPPFITGQNRPYGTPVVQTFYPRSQAPRLTNLQTGPVVAAGTWPDLLQADASPVFRTPVRRPGEQQISLPPGAGVAGLAGGYTGLSGYGHIPLGVARPPTEMYERAVFGSRGTAGFGEEPAAGTLPDSLTVLGRSYSVSPEEWQQLIANQGQLRSLLYSLYRIYAGLLSQIEHYNFVVGTFTVTHPDYAQRLAYAQGLVFGSPENQARASAQYSAIIQVREDLRASVTADQVAGMPADLLRMFDMFVNQSTPSMPTYSGFGVGPIAFFGLPWLIAATKWAIAGAALLLGAYTVGEIASGVMGRRAKELEAERALAAAKGVADVNRAMAAAIDALTETIRRSPSPNERALAIQQIGNLKTAWANVNLKVNEVNAASGFMTWAPIVAGVAIIGALFVALRWLGGKAGGGGGSAGIPSGGGASSTVVHVHGALPAAADVMKQIG